MVEREEHGRALVGGHCRSSGRWPCFEAHQFVAVVDPAVFRLKSMLMLDPGFDLVAGSKPDGSSFVQDNA